MSRLMNRPARLALSFALTTMVAFSAALPAFADNGVSIAVNPGSRTASVATATLEAITYEHTDQSKSGSLVLTADDSTGSGLGWNVTVQTSNFTYSGTGIGGATIPAVNFAIVTANAPSWTIGQAIDAEHGPRVPVSGAVGTLESAHKVLQAEQNYGLGTYTQALDVSLLVPGQSRAGTYSATLTVSIIAAP